ncbi:MAG: 50S ribosomal protein L17 [Chloroflexi bacterium]|nr:50S ribosomal protein L17 [Chloroflexota bacterium]
MRHRVTKPRLNRPLGHRRALVRNLVGDLFRHEQIATTEAKAKAIRSYAERLITWGKRGDLHARRLALAFLYEEELVNKLFHEIAPRFGERNGGYTRIVKLGQRQGDGAPVAQISLVE